LLLKEVPALPNKIENLASWTIRDIYIEWVAGDGMAAEG